MAYTREKPAACPIPGDPGVIPVTIVATGAGSSAPVSMAIKVPWNNVKLTYAYSALVAIPTSADVVVTLTNTGGTTIGTFTITESGSAVGDIDELTFSSHAAADDLNDADTITIAWYGGAAGVGTANVFLFFEPSVS